MSANPILASLIPAAPPAARSGAAPSSSAGGDGAAFEGLLNGYSESGTPGAVETPPSGAVPTTAPAAAQSALPTTLYALALRSAATHGAAPDPNADSVPAATTPKAAPAAPTVHASAAPTTPRPLPTLAPPTATNDAKPPLPATNPKGVATGPTSPAKAPSKTSPPDEGPNDPVAANPAPTSSALASQGFPQLAAVAPAAGASAASTGPTNPAAPTPRAAAPATPPTASPPRTAAAKTSTPPSDAPAAADTLATQTALPPNAASPSDSGSAALAAAVLSIAQAISPFDAETGGAPAAATAAAPVVASPLPLRGVQARTHLTVVGSRLFSVASARAQQALESEPTSPPTPAPAVAVAPAAALPKATSGAPSGGAPARDDAAATTPARPFVSDATAGLVAAPTPAAATNSVPVADLGDRLADEAATLTPAAQDPTTAAPRGPVKELMFQLEPADLGKVAVKLRLSTGRLTVDIGVDNPGALSELEKQRDAMAAKLSSSAQPLESLVIHQQSAPENPAGEPTASSAGFFDSPASGEGATRRQANGPPDRQARAPAPASAPNAPLAQRSDLLV
jgi:hypothetical protein